MENLTREQIRKFLHLEHDHIKDETIDALANKAEHIVQELIQTTFAELRSKYEEVPHDVVVATLIIVNSIYDYDTNFIPEVRRHIVMPVRIILEPYSNVGLADRIAAFDGARLTLNPLS